MEKRNDRWASRTFCSSFHVKGVLRLRTLFHFFFLSYEFFRRIQYSLEPVWKSISAICAPFCSIFYPNSVAVAHYGALILVKSPTNCDVHLAEKLFSNTLKEQKSYTLIFCLNTDFTVRKNGLCISLSKIHKINTWKWWTVLLSDWRK